MWYGICGVECDDSLTVRVFKNVKGTCVLLM